ncbi:MAG: GTP cyclohydrolase I FolE2 [Candidatus Anammoximicrobium sp.]|nr:GTP cyclohydrolase I FolE2 [Candidatus Anammoximicrobium sp.]
MASEATLVPPVPFPLDPALESPPPLPDIVQDTVAPVGGCLDRVGMSGIEVALRVRHSADCLVLTPARATAQVSLDDPDAKGIHMSRLFLTLQETLEDAEFSLPLMERLLQAFLASHTGLSRSSLLKFQFEYLAKRNSLLSDHTTWRSYPVWVAGELSDSGFRHTLQVSVAYSSTCPCSAALARQLLQQQFMEDFADHRWLSVSQVLRWLGSQGTLATPHSQRSHAVVQVVLHPDCREYPLVTLIDAVETAVATPVQAVVKRSDEQEFARLNGENLMLCEDSARRIRASLEATPEFADYRIQASHLESLHPHDAVAIVTKGVPGGLRP